MSKPMKHVGDFVFSAKGKYKNLSSYMKYNYTLKDYNEYKRHGNSHLDPRMEIYTDDETMQKYEVSDTIAYDFVLDSAFERNCDSSFCNAEKVLRVTSFMDESSLFEDPDGFEETDDDLTYVGCINYAFMIGEAVIEQGYLYPSTEKDDRGNFKLYRYPQKSTYMTKRSQLQKVMNSINSYVTVQRINSTWLTFSVKTESYDNVTIFDESRDCEHITVGENYKLVHVNNIKNNTVE